MAEQERYEQLLRDKIRVDLERDKARAEVERLREAIEEHEAAKRGRTMPPTADTERRAAHADSELWAALNASDEGANVPAT